MQNCFQRIGRYLQMDNAAAFVWAATLPIVMKKTLYLWKTPLPQVQLMIVLIYAKLQVVARYVLHTTGQMLSNYFLLIINTLSHTLSFQFFTWSTTTSNCGLRCYHPNTLINAPTLRTGTPSGINPQPNKVYVGRTISE